MDTQADISIIKESEIGNHFHFDHSNTIDIRGITEGTIRTIGTIQAKIYTPMYILKHELHVVPEHFDIPVPGIIGRDFMRLFQCKLDYNNNTLTIRLDHESVRIPIHEGPDEHSLIIPARSEVIRKLNKLKIHSDSLIPSQQFQDEVFMANTIINAANPFVRIVNTSDKDVKIQTNNIVPLNLDNYEIRNCAHPCTNTNTDRTNKLLAVLKPNFPKHISNELTQLCAEFSDIFSVEGDKSTTNNFYQQSLKLHDQTPVYIKNYRTPHSQKLEIHNKIQELLKNDLIEPSVSSYNSPIILVPKKGQTDKKQWRLCIDYRQLNKRLIPDKFPLPRIEEILDNLGRARYFSVLDLQAGFHQVPIVENSRDITSFSTEQGSFRWKVLPFGLNISPNSFSRMMSLAFSGLPQNICFVYIDDLIVLGNSETHHLNNLREVFQTCRKHSLTLNPSKSQFFKTEVTYLGHKCTSKGLLPDENKNEVIRKYPRPEDKDSVRRFVAFTNYYRRFIPRFAELTKPLNHITKKNSVFIWTPECENSFQNLKKILLHPPILQYPDFSKQFILTVDASQIACGAVLSQNHGDKDLPIAFASKTFTKADKNKTTIERELIAIHWGIKHFRPYLYGTPFLVKSDHRPLSYLFSLKDPTSKLSRIRLDLAEYNFTVEYLKGKHNVCADALSRIDINDLKDIQKHCVLAVTRSMTNKAKQQEKIDKPARDAVKEPIITETNDNYAHRKLPLLSFDTQNNKYLRVHVNTNNDRTAPIIDLHIKYTSIKVHFYENVLNKLDAASNEVNINKLRMYKNDAIFNMIPFNLFQKLCFENLKYITIIVTAPPVIIHDNTEKLSLISKYHADPIHGGHAGIKKVYSRLRSIFKWKNMSRDIVKFINNCETCNKNKPRQKTKEPMVITTTPQTPFSLIIIDTVGPLPTSPNGNKYILTIICDLSKYLITIPIPNKEATTIARAIFENCFLIYGPAKQVLSDLGTEFKNSIITELYSLLQINHSYSTPYHPQTVGSIERSHRTMNEYFRAYLNENNTNWDEYLKYFTYCYNTTKHTSLQLKYSPYELIFGRVPTLPHELVGSRVEPLYNTDSYAQEVKYKLQITHQLASKLLLNAKLANKKIYDKNINPTELQINDKIFVKDETAHKLKPIYKGPYVIQEIDNTNVTYCNENGKLRTIHKNLTYKIK